MRLGPLQAFAVLCLLASAGAVASCVLNPQPEPPLTPNNGDNTAGSGTGAGLTTSTGSGGPPSGSGGSAGSGAAGGGGGMSFADGAAEGPVDASADAATSDGLPPAITRDADAGDGSNPSNADASTDDAPLGDGRPQVVGHDAVPDALGNGPD